MDFSRLRNGEIFAAVSGLALFIFMFFHWFGGGISAWDALQDFSGFLIALAAVSGVTLGALAAVGQRINLPFQRGVGTLALGELAVLLILWRILANPGDLKIGIFLGLIAAAGIAIGAWMALREDGFEPLVKVPGGRTKVASASAPAATPTPRPAVAPGGSSSGGSRSGKSTAAKSRSGGGTAKKSRAGGSKSSAKKAPGKKKSTASRSKSSSSSRSKSGGSSKAKSSGSSKRKSSGSSPRSKSSGSSRSKSRGSSRSKSSASSRSTSSGTRSRSKSSGSRARSKSSGTRRRRSSGGRK